MRGLTVTLACIAFGVVVTACSSSGFVGKSGKLGSAPSNDDDNDDTKDDDLSDDGAESGGASTEDAGEKTADASGTMERDSSSQDTILAEEEELWALPLVESAGKLYLDGGIQVAGRPASDGIYFAGIVYENYVGGSSQTSSMSFWDPVAKEWVRHAWSLGDTGVGDRLIRAMGVLVTVVATIPT